MRQKVSITNISLIKKVSFSINTITDLSHSLSSQTIGTLFLQSQTIGSPYPSQNTGTNSSTYQTSRHSIANTS